MELAQKLGVYAVYNTAQAQTLSYLAVKLFSKYSNICDHGT